MKLVRPCVKLQMTDTGKYKQHRITVPSEVIEKMKLVKGADVYWVPTSNPYVFAVTKLPNAPDAYFVGEVKK